MTIVTILFVLSLIAVVILFVVKHLEETSKIPRFAESHREHLDTKIVKIEQYLVAKCTQENIMLVLSNVYNTMTHIVAKAAASIAKKIEWRARSVAHKSAKARRVVEGGTELSRGSEFLKDVQSYKDSLDTAKVAEQAKL